MGLPYQAHRYIIEELGGQHAQSKLTIRYVKFLQSLKRSPKRCVQFLLEKVSRNVNTVTGRNMRYILDKTENRCDVFSLTQNIKKKSLKFFEILDEDKWRVSMLREITNIRQGVLTLNGENLSDDELEELFEFISLT